VPFSVAVVASQLITAIDTQSGGQYAIRPTTGNVALLARWMANEGGLWADNPLNTTYQAGSYPHQFTSAGVDSGSPIYPSMNVGIRDTALTLLGGSSYRKILTELALGNASCTAFANAVIRSPWAASHYGYNAAAFCDAAPSGALRPGHRGRHGGAKPRHPTPSKKHRH